MLLNTYNSSYVFMCEADSFVNCLCIFLKSFSYLGFIFCINRGSPKLHSAAWAKDAFMIKINFTSSAIFLACQIM
jgi:hypothetical protein